MRTGLAASFSLALLVAAAASGQVHPRIANGVLAWDPPSVGALLCDAGIDACTPESGAEPAPPLPIEWCSGFLVGCRTFVIAAHCVCGVDGTHCNETVPRDVARYSVFLQHAGVFAVESIRVHPDYLSLGLWNDVAVLTLADPVEGLQPAIPNESSPLPAGTPGTIVGFGESAPNAGDYGVKRDGAVTTVACPPQIHEDLLCWSYQAPPGPPGSNSTTCNGDSGGPLIIDLGPGPVVAGITRTGTCNTGVATDTEVAAIADFIQAEAGADLGTTCGSNAIVGTPGTRVDGFSGSLSEASPDDSFQLDVLPNRSVLRLAMNGSELGEFDLYAKAGAPPSPSDFDCAVAEPGQFGGCEVPAPTPGTWEILITRISGEGSFQVTAVAVPEPAAAPLVWLGAAVLVALRLGRPARPSSTRRS